MQLLGSGHCPSADSQGSGRSCSDSRYSRGSPRRVTVSFLLVCFTSFFVFRIADLPHSPGVVYYHLLLRRENRIPGVAPFSFRIGIWDLFVHRGQKSYTPTAFGKLWTTPGVRCMKHLLSRELPQKPRAHLGILKREGMLL